MIFRYAPDAKWHSYPVLRNNRIKFVPRSKLTHVDLKAHHVARKMAKKMDNLVNQNKYYTTEKLL